MFRRHRRIVWRGVLVAAMTGGVFAGLPVATPAFADTAPVLVNVPAAGAATVERFVASSYQASLDLNDIQPITDQTAQALIDASGIDTSGAQVEAVAASPQTLAVVLAAADANGLAVSVWTIDRATAIATKVTSALADVGNGHVRAAITDDPKAFVSGPAADGTACQACAEGTSLGELLAPLLCSDQDFCSVLLYATGEALSQFCNETGCSYRYEPGIQPGYPQCLYSSCDFEVNVDNGSSSRSLTTLASTVYWIYAPQTEAQLSTGAYTDEWGDGYTVCCYSQNAIDYTWVHNSTQPAWAKCSARVQYYVFAQWSDGWEMESPLLQASKLVGTGCPGFKVNS